MYARRRSRGLRLVILAVASSLPPPPAALGDGFAFKSRDISGLLPLHQLAQAAAIHHRDGVQHMLITINVSLEDDERGLWIFPLPGTPDAVDIDLVDRFPALRGEDPRRRAREGVGALMSLVRSTQVYPVLYDLAWLPSLGVGSLEMSARVAESVEKWGLRAEVVGAADAAALAEYLQPTRPGVTAADLAPFASYFTGEHTFVVAWLQSQAELAAEFPDLERRRPAEGRWPTLFVSFPTPTAFYPMKPTAAYGDETIDVLLYVLGCAAPRTHAGLARILECRQFEQDAVSADLPVEFTAGLPPRQIPYTRIRASTPARNFVDDLRFVPAEPPDRAYITAVRGWTAPPWLALSWAAATLVLSYVSAGVAGLLVFRRWGRPALLGLWNVLTILAFGLAVNRAAFHTANDAAGPPARPGGRPGKRPKIAFVLLTSLIFVSLTAVAQVALQSPLVG